MLYQKDSTNKVNMLKEHEYKIKWLVTNVYDVGVQKASKSLLETLETRLNKFTELEHMDYLTNTLLPKIYTFANSIDSFVDQLKEMKEVVRRFDKIICMKSEKTDFTVFK